MSGNPAELFTLLRLPIIVAAAYILDLLLGDPMWLPHPVVLTGRLISFLERIIRKHVGEGIFGGALLVAIVSAVSFFLPLLLLRLLGLLGFWPAFLVEIFFCYQLFAARSLRDESMKVYNVLKTGDIAGSRRQLSYIVGRDTENLTEPQIIKATVETVAENTTDGVIAPAFYMALFGLPLAMLYKAINTMDSMLGYKNERYLLFGRVAARLDDVANFIPARLAAVFMLMMSGVAGLSGKNALKIYIRDRKQHKSPNAGQTESVAAGALSVQLAGDGSYFGRTVHKPTIGDPIREVTAFDIVLINRLMYFTSTLGVSVFILLRGLF